MPEDNNVLPVGTVVLLTSPIRIKQDDGITDFFPVCAKGVIIDREVHRPRVVIDGCSMLLFDGEIRKSPW